MDQAFENLCKAVGVDPARIRKHMDQENQDNLTETQKIGLKLIRLGQQYSNKNK